MRLAPVLLATAAASACSPGTAPLALPGELAGRSAVLVIGDEAFAFVLPQASVDVRAPDDAPIHLFVYDETLAARQLSVDRDHRLIQAPADGRDLPGARVTFAGGPQWSAIADAPLIRAAIELPAFDGERCVAESGCFAIESPETCLLPCPASSVPAPPAPPAAPAPPARPVHGECPPGSDAERVEAWGGEVALCRPRAIATCALPAVQRWGEDGCAPVDACGGSSPDAALYVAPGGMGDGSSPARPLDSIDAALAIAAPGTTIALAEGDHAAPGGPIEARIIGACAAGTRIQGGITLGTGAGIERVSIAGVVEIRGRSVHLAGVIAQGLVSRFTSQASGSDVHVVAAADRLAITVEHATLALDGWTARGRYGLAAAGSTVTLSRGVFAGSDGLIVRGGRTIVDGWRAEVTAQALAAAGSAHVRGERWVTNGGVLADGAAIELRASVAGPPAIRGGRVAYRDVRLAGVSDVASAADGAHLSMEDVSWIATAPLELRASSGATLAVARAELDPGSVESASATVDLSDFGARSTADAALGSDGPGGVTLVRARLQSSPEHVAIVSAAKLRGQDLEIGPAGGGIAHEAGLAELERVWIHDLVCRALFATAPVAIEDLTVERIAPSGRCVTRALLVGAGGSLARVLVRTGGYDTTFRVESSTPEHAAYTLTASDLDLTGPTTVSLSGSEGTIIGERWRLRGTRDRGRALQVTSLARLEIRDLDAAGDAFEFGIVIAQLGGGLFERFLLASGGAGVLAESVGADSGILWRDGLIESNGTPSVIVAGEPWRIFDRTAIRGPSPRLGRPR